MRMSAFIASESPRPTATPLTPARTGFSHSTRMITGRWRSAPSSSGSSRLVVGSGCWVEVEPGAERVAVPGDGDRPHVVVVRRLAQRGHEGPDELAGRARSSARAGPAAGCAAAARRRSPACRYTRSSSSILIALPRRILYLASSSRPVEDLLAVLLRVRPRRVGVRVVGLEADVVLADLRERVHAVLVPGEAAEDAPVVVGGRRLRAQALGVDPGVVLLPHRVGPLERVRDPADLALGVRDLQLRELRHLPAEEVVAERRHRVVERDHAADARGASRRRCGVARRRADVHADGRAGLARTSNIGSQWPVWMLGRSRRVGSSLKHTARTPRAALRSISFTASCASHSGMMQSGMFTPIAGSHHSSTIQSL